MKLTDEVPLFVVDPKDSARKNVGTLQTYDDGSICWYKRIAPEHVMRLGSFGFDSITYDTHFRGKNGTIKLERVRPDGTVQNVYITELAIFDKKAKANDYGHGRQYFLPFSFWTADGDIKATRDPKREPAAPVEMGRIVFGSVIVCPGCKAVRRDVTKHCKVCRGTGIVPNTAGV
jgi:hypothetical protein